MPAPCAFALRKQVVTWAVLPLFTRVLYLSDYNYRFVSCAVVHGSKRRRKSIPDPSLVIDSSAQHAADIYRQLNPFRAASRARPSWEDRVDGGVTSRHHAPAGRRVSLYVGRVQRLARSRQRDLGPIASRPSQPASHFNLEEVQWRARVYVLGVWTQPLQGSVDDLPERGAPLRRQQTELRRWVERELWALLPDIDTELIQALVLSLLRTRGSTADTLEALRPFLGSRAGQFWHELRWCETEMACRL